MTKSSKDVLRALAAIAALALCAWTGAAQEKGDSLAIEPLEPISQQTKIEFQFTLKVKTAETPTQFRLAKLHRAGQETPVPKNMQLDPAKGLFTWTPTPSQAGSYELTVAAKDAKDREARLKVRLTVTEREIVTGKNPVADLLRKWHAEGTAAGNTGDFYDNRDGDHSPLNLAPWPQLDQVVYTEEDKKARRHWAAQRVVLPHVVFGNSSTSAHVTTGGSNVRMYYTSAFGLDLLYQHYRKNNVYIYPEHLDHDPGHNGKPGYGDLYPINTPYLITSQGSSGSDQPFMRAIPYTLAAFRPEVKKKLIETGLLMPTVQMLLRSCNKHIADPKEYLTGKAHPTVFEGSWVSDLKMVQAAHDIQLDTIPPLVRLKVVEEDAAVAGKDYFEPGLTEKLVDTPCAIGRIIRGTQQVRRMVVSAEESFDVNKKPLRFHWVVLRGDAGRIQIKPLNQAGSVVEIRVAYHDRYQVKEPVPIGTNRVDIGAFADNGAYYSAPGFVSFYSLDSEARTYDDEGKLLEIGYGLGEAVFTVADWNVLFDLFKEEPKTLSARLIHKPLKEGELTALRTAGAEYSSASEELAVAQEKSKKAAAARQTTLARLKKAEEQVQAAKKAHDDKPSEAATKALAEAKADYDSAFSFREIAEEQAKEAQKSADAANKTVTALLNQKRPGIDAPIRERVEQILNGLRDNPTFYRDNRAAIDSLYVRSRTTSAESKRNITSSPWSPPWPTS